MLSLLISTLSLPVPLYQIASRECQEALSITMTVLCGFLGILNNSEIVQADGQRANRLGGAGGCRCASSRFEQRPGGAQGVTAAIMTDS